MQGQQWTSGSQPPPPAIPTPPPTPPPAFGPGGNPKAFQAWKARSAVHRTRMRGLSGGENNALAQTLIEAASNPGGQTSSLADVMYKTDNIEAVRAVTRTFQMTPIQTIRRFVGNMDADTVRAALATNPSASAIIARLDDANARQLRAVAVRGYQINYLQRIIDDATEVIGGVSTLNPERFAHGLTRGGPQRFHLVMQDRKLYRDLIELMGYVDDIHARPAGAKGVETLSFRAASQAQTALRGAANLPIQLSSVAAGTATTAALGGPLGAIVFGGGAIGLPFGLAKLMSSPRHIEKLLRVAAQLQDPLYIQSTRLNWASTGTAMTQAALRNIIHMDESGRTNKLEMEERRKSESSGPSLPMGE